MRSAFVVDATVAVAWVQPGQATAQTDAMLDALVEGAVLEVPALWPLEVANALTVLARRKKLTDSERRKALAFFRALPLRVDHDMAVLAFEVLSSLAVTCQLSVYDACYLELAQRRGIPLGCKDGPLRKAALLQGVAVWE